MASIEVSSLSDLIDYIRQNGERVYRRANETRINPDTGKIGILLDGQTVSDPYPWDWHEMSTVALRNLSHIFNIPPAYVTRVPTDLAALNVNYFTSRSDRQLELSLTEDVVSEIKALENDRTIFEILDAVRQVFGRDDLKVVQAYIKADSVQFLVYLPEEEETPLGLLHRGVSLIAPINKSKDVHSEPVLVNAQDEEAIEFAVHKNTDEVDLTNLVSVMTVARDHMERIDDIIIRNRSHVIESADYFVSRYGAKNGLATTVKRCVREEIMNSGDSTAIGVARAVMNAQNRTKSPIQFMKLIRMAADAFFAVDPVYCDHCHQEIPDEESKEIDELED